MKIFFKIISFFPALLMMYFMFGFSSANGGESQSMSTRITKIMIKITDNLDLCGIIEVPEEKQLEFLQPKVRKAAHIAEYFFLCLLLILPLRYSFPKLGRKRILIAAVICFLFACSDEWHQRLVPGRDGNPGDIGIDSVGIALASLLALLREQHSSGSKRLS